MSAPSDKDRERAELLLNDVSLVMFDSGFIEIASQMFQSVRAEGIARGREEERREIVAWLRKIGGPWTNAANNYADHIERADHAPAGETKKGEGET